MIFVASQRGGGAQLASHLLNEKDNEQVEVSEITGAMTDDLREAFDEFHAVSKGTRCTQYLFSVSLSPPPGAKASHDLFLDALARIEKKMGLEGQPRALVYHTKNNRRHLHAVWSRIDIEHMKAINLSFFKDKLMSLSKEIFLEQNWDMPKGLIDREHSNPLNFTRAEWEQAKRLGNDPRLIKATLKHCWQHSDNRKSFEAALKKHGYTLARGDRRGYVAVDWQGEVFSLSRATGAKTKELAERLGDPKDLPSVTEAKAAIDQQLKERVQAYTGQINDQYKARSVSMDRVKDKMLERHARERGALSKKQSVRWQQEHAQRQARFRKGVKGLWQRVTGAHKSIQQQNEWETYETHKRDQQERDDLIYNQIEERHELQSDLQQLNTERLQDIENLKTKVFTHLSENPQAPLKPTFDHAASPANDTPKQGPDMNMSM